MPTSIRATAALLDELDALLASVGSPVAACRDTAAGVLRFDGFRLTKPFHLLVPYERTPRRVGHHVHRTRAYDPAMTVTVEGIRCTSPTLTLIQLAGTHAPKAVTVALDGALRDRLTSETNLHETISRMRHYGRHEPVAMLELLQGAEVVRGGQSWLERRFLELVAEAQLPRPATQQVLAKRKRHLVRVDCRFTGTPVVVELLGYRWHRSPADLQRDAERGNALTLAGYRVMQFTYTHVTEEPQWMIGQVREALAL
jgi:very-short-patch-repair endonuclease